MTINVFGKSWTKYVLYAIELVKCTFSLSRKKDFMTVLDQ